MNFIYGVVFLFFPSDKRLIFPTVDFLVACTKTLNVATETKHNKKKQSIPIHQLYFFYQL